jgi:hypothetical protein
MGKAGLTEDNMESVTYSLRLTYWKGGEMIECPDWISAIEKGREILKDRHDSVCAEVLQNLREGDSVHTSVRDRILK